MNASNTSRFWSVNWMDAMIVSSRHFRDQEEAHEKRLAWAVHHALRGTYGLARAQYELAGGCSWTIRPDTAARALIEVSHCFGITPDGSRIAFQGPEERVEGYVPVEPGQREKRVHLYVTASAESNPRGEQAPDEIPPRQSSSMPRYQLLWQVEGPSGDRVSGVAVPRERSLRIGSAIISTGHAEAELLDIPPCLTLDADVRLDRQTREIVEKIGKIKSAAALVAGRAISGDVLELRTVDVASRAEDDREFISDLAFFCRNLAVAIAGQYEWLRDNRAVLSPREFYFGCRSILNVWDTLLVVWGDERTQLLFGKVQYWTREKSPRELCDMIRKFLADDISFDQDDLHNHVSLIEQAVSRLYDLFEPLGQNENWRKPTYPPPSATGPKRNPLITDIEQIPTRPRRS